MPQFTSSAVYVRGLGRGVATYGKTDALRRLGGDVVARMLDEPASQAWWPQPDVVAFCTAIHEAGGETLMADVGRFVVTDSISLVVQPFVRMVSARGVVTPATFLSRFGQFSLTAIRNVLFHWTERSPTSGELVIEYPPGVPPLLAPLWLGAIEYTYEVARCGGRPTVITTRGPRFVFAVQWQ